MRKTFIFIAFFVSILSLLIGCKKEEPLQINPTELTMQVGETANIESINSSGELKYVSSDENVATVNDGLVTAIAAGNAVITVSDDKTSLTCNVKVEGPKYDGAYVIDLDTDIVDLIIGDEYQLEPRLLRGQDALETANFKYTSFDESIASVENGKIKALAIGQASIQIDSIEYPNVSKVVTVNVNNNFTIDLSETNLTLTMFNVLDYTTSKEVSYIVKDNGNLLNDSSLTVNNSNEEVVSVEKAGNNYLITALTYGESKISFSCKKEDGTEAISYINVEVIKPVIQLDEYHFSKIKGTLDFSKYDFTEYNIAFDANSCEKIYDEFGNVHNTINKNETTVTINTTNIDETGEIRTMYYDMGQYIIEIDIIQCTLAIETVEDFLSMSTLLISKKANDGDMYKRVDGYIELINDLDFSGMEYTPFSGYEQIDYKFGGRAGWNATFEGNNKALKNIKFGSDTEETIWNSIFGNVGFDGKIRNLAIVDCSFGAMATGGVLADYFYGTVENVFISVTLSAGKGGSDVFGYTSGFTAATPYNAAIINNVTILVKNELTENNYVIAGPASPYITQTERDKYYLNNAKIVCIGGADSQLLYGKTLKDIKDKNGKKGFIYNYDTIEKAANSFINDNGSASFDNVDGKLQIKFDGTIVYNG